MLQLIRLTKYSTPIAGSPTLLAPKKMAYSESNSSSLLNTDKSSRALTMIQIFGNCPHPEKAKLLIGGSMSLKPNSFSMNHLS